jgi:hypothetical protein
MGLDDQAEKKKQAEEWLENGTPEQQAAAREYLTYVGELDACPYGCMPMDHGC